MLLSPRLRRLTTVAGLACRGLLIALLAAGVLVALISVQLGAAALLAAGASLAIWRLRAARRRLSALPQPLIADVGRCLATLEALGWKIKPQLATPHGPVSYLAVPDRAHIAFAVLVADRDLVDDDLDDAAAIADWIAATGSLNTVVPVLVGGKLRDIEQLAGPVLIVSGDRLLAVLGDAAEHARTLLPAPSPAPA